MFGYASDETSDCMPLTHSMATRLGKTLTEVRKSGECWWLRPDGKTQVTIEYMQHPDGSVEPKKIHTVVISTQHAEPSKAKRTQECAGYTGAEMVAPSMEQMNKEIEEKVIKRTLQSIKLKSGQPAISLYGSHTHLHINPSGKFIIGGPQGDAGLTGRKIIIDSWRCFCLGACFSQTCGCLLLLFCVVTCCEHLTLDHHYCGLRTRMEAGEPMAVVPSPARTPPRWTDQLPTSAARWPSPWSTVA